jgi:hypothetical protein
MTPDEVARRAVEARTYAMRFDRANVFDRLFGALPVSLAA